MAKYKATVRTFVKGKIRKPGEIFDSDVKKPSVTWEEVESKNRGNAKKGAKKGGKKGGNAPPDSPENTDPESSEDQGEGSGDENSGGQVNPE